MALSDFFQLVPIPENSIQGFYSLDLVAISYGIAFFTSYIALDFAGRLRVEPNTIVKWYWLIGGAFSMGAGIWSMHFIGMLAFILPMYTTYELFWTISSLFVAILSSGFALLLLRDEQSSGRYLFAGGIVLGLGIVTMNFMGMRGMTGVDIHYLPGLFTWSIVVAILASEAALWFVLKSSNGTFVKQMRLKIISALIMGAAICGMHYIGMAAAVFTPSTISPVMIKNIEPYSLALSIAWITGVILTIALITSTYKQLITSSAQNEKDFLNAVLNNLADGVLACDYYGKITVVNPALKRLINIRQSDQIEEKYLEYFSYHQPNQDEPLPTFELPINRALRGEKFADWELDLKVRNSEDKRHVIVSGQPIYNSMGEKLGAVVTFHDMSEGKKAKELEDLNKELEDFANITSHDLKAPLRAIESLATWIEEDSYATLDTKSKQNFDLLKKRIQRMNALIEGILHYSRAGRKNIESSAVNVRRLLEDIILGLNIPPHFTIKIATDMPTLITPEVLLQQVFSNLINNAIKHHSGPRGNITLSAETVGNYYQFCVEDDGPGIPKEDKERIFIIYQTLFADSVNETAGIGLAIVKKAIGRANGKVWVESEVGKGCRFYFTWPATL